MYTVGRCIQHTGMHTDNIEGMQKADCTKALYHWLHTACHVTASHVTASHVTASHVIATVLVSATPLAPQLPISTTAVVTCDACGQSLGELEVCNSHLLLMQM